MDKRIKNMVTAGLLIGLLVAALDQTIVDTAFPSMIRDLHGEAIYTWVLTTYLLTSTAIVPVVGKLADIYGRKIFYLAGMAFFIGGSMLCGQSQTMTQLILFRGIQGIGGGMLMPVAFTIVGDIFPGEQRAKMQGVFGAVWGLAAVLGPSLGGWITENLSWRWVFYVNLPVGIIAVVLMVLFYRESRGERRPIDWIGSVTVTGSITALLLALKEGGDAWAWSSWQSLGLFGVGLLFLAIFIIAEIRVPEPILDLALFKNRTFTIMSIVGFLIGGAMMLAIFYVPLFVQGVLGATPKQAGNLMTPTMLAMVVFSVIAGRMALKMSYRHQMSLSFVVMAIGFYLMTSWSASITLLRATLCTMVIGAGIGIVMPLLTLAMQNAFPITRRGVVTSASSFFRQIGSVVGITVAGILVNDQMTAEFHTQMAPLMTKAAPLLAKLPPQAAGMFQQIKDNPPVLIRVLLAPEAQAAIPAAFRDQFVGIVKSMMANSLHIVFWTGIGVVFFGLLVTQIMGNVSLKTQAKELGEDVVLEAPMVAD